jgi:hypothetical protein
MTEKIQSKTKDIVLITGANGHLAKVVSQHLCKDYIVRHLTTNKTSSLDESYFYWDVTKKLIDKQALENCDHIVHLAGLSILKKWTKKNKKIMYDSRVKAADLIFETCKTMNVKPKTFISASAIGIYDQSISKGKTHEESNKGNNWIANMANDWEKASNKFKKIDSRVIQMRISLIFSEKAGFLRYNILSMKFGLGAIIGDKNKITNWIHVKDLARFVKESIKNKSYNGPFNIACDDDSSQEDIIKKIRKYILPYAIILKIPLAVVKFFLGERSQIIDTHLKLETKKLKKNGFHCKINTLDEIFNS